MNNMPNSAELEEYPRALFLAVTTAYRGWLARRLLVLLGETFEGELPDEVLDVSVLAVNEQLFNLLRLDVDEQRTNPLHILRESTNAASQWLRAVGIIPTRRDEFEISAMPNDIYSIGPLTWKDLGESVHEAGINWGAWKAAVILQRRRVEGKIV